MFKKTLICALVLAVMSFGFVLPVSAASSSWATFKIPAEYDNMASIWTDATGGDYVPISGNRVGDTTYEFQIPAYSSSVTKVFARSIFPKFEVSAGDTVLIHSVHGGFGGWFGGNGNVIHGYRWTLQDGNQEYIAKGEYIEAVRNGGNAWNLTWPDYEISISKSGTVCELLFEIVMTHPTANNFTMNMKELTISYGNYAVYEQMQEQKETNEKLDQIIQQPQQEKQEANKSGQEGVGNITNALPDYSSGLTNAIQQIVEPMTYTGTDAKWVIPSITMPAISGVMDEMVLADNLEINFEEWFNRAPTEIIEVVRILFTVALIVYCVKELYSNISYLLTLKGGGASE